MKTELKRLKELRDMKKAIEEEIDQLNRVLLPAMPDRVVIPGAVAFKITMQRVSITDEFDLDEKWMALKPDTAKISAALKKGKQIYGAELITTSYVKFK